jgi:hypothetical protein
VGSHSTRRTAGHKTLCLCLQHDLNCCTGLLWLGGSQASYHHVTGAVLQVWLQKEFSHPMASVKIQKLTVQRLRPFLSTPKPPEAAEAAEEAPPVLDPAVDAGQFAQHAAANGCEELLHAASFGIHGGSLSRLLQQVRPCLLVPGCERPGAWLVALPCTYSWIQVGFLPVDAIYVYLCQGQGFWRCLC